jgi:hypothetical protein
MSENSFGWSYFSNENDNNKDTKLNNVPSLAERDIGKTTINEKDSEWTSVNGPSVNGPSVNGPSVTKFESNDETRTGVSIVTDVTNKDKNYITLADLPTKTLNGTTEASQSISGDAITGERNVDVKQEDEVAGTSVKESDKKTSMNYVDEPKYDYLTNIYVGSLTIVGLYIFFRIIEKSK